MSPPSPSRIYSIRILLLAVLLLLGAPVSAQETISLNETKIGQLTGVGSASYSFVSPPGLSVHIEVIAATQGLAPQFSIFNANNALVQTIGNPSFGLVVEDTVTLPGAGVYRIEVTSASGASGQFVIQMNSGSPPVAALALTLNVPVFSTLAANERASYSFSTGPQSGVGLEISTNGTAGLSATLSDGNGSVIGSMGSTLIGLRFDLPPGQSVYRLELANDGSLIGQVSYRVTLLSGVPGLPISTPPVQVITATSTQEPIIAPSVTPGSSLPPLPETGACVVATAEANAVNIRATASTNSDIIGQMSYQNVYSVIGVNFNRSWYQITFDGQTGWVAGFVVRTGGSCTGLPVIDPPPEPTLVPTLQPETIPTRTVAQLNAACSAKYGSGAFIFTASMSCFTCPANYTRRSPDDLICSQILTTRADRQGLATGLLRTDCPRGQFWDPNGYCWTCPAGYQRGVVFSVTSDRACYIIRSRDPVTPIQVGPP